jgi:hypothetical protein
MVERFALLLHIREDQVQIPAQGPAVLKEIFHEEYICDISPPFSGSKNRPSTIQKAGGKQSSAYFSTLKIEAIYSSETYVHFQRTTRHCILGGGLKPP